MVPIAPYRPPRKVGRAVPSPAQMFSDVTAGHQSCTKNLLRSCAKAPYYIAVTMARSADTKTPCRNPVPRHWRNELQKVLITERKIARRIKTLSTEIERDFAGRELVIVAVLNGTILFLADLIRCLSLPLRLDFVGVSSYAVGTESADLLFTKEL